MDRTDLEWVTPNPAGKWEASGRNDTSTPRSKLMLIEFVVNSGDNKSQIRRHAIRESWRQRNHGRSKLPATHRGPGARETLPKIAHRHQNTPSTGKEAAVAESDLKIEAEWGRRTLYSSGGPDIPGAEVAKRERLHACKGLFLDIKHSMALTHELVEARTTLSTCHLPQGLSLRHPLGDAGFGPVNGIHLSREDKKLLHHCKSSSLSLFCGNLTNRQGLMLMHTTRMAFHLTPSLIRYVTFLLQLTSLNLRVSMQLWLTRRAT